MNKKSPKRFTGFTFQVRGKSKKEINPTKSNKKITRILFCELKRFTYDVAMMTVAFAIIVTFCFVGLPIIFPYESAKIESMNSGKHFSQEAIASEDGYSDSFGNNLKISNKDIDFLKSRIEKSDIQLSSFGIHLSVVVENGERYYLMTITIKESSNASGDTQIATGKGKTKEEALLNTIFELEKRL